MLSDGSMVAVGYDYPDVWSVHVSSTGDFLGKTLLPDGFVSGGYPNKFAGMVGTSDGGWAACGIADDNLVIWKFSALNEYEWHTILGVNVFESCTHDAFSQTADNGYLLATERNDSAILRRFDHDGILSWENSYSASNGNKGGQATELTTGNIATTYQIPGGDNESWFVSLLDASGNLISEQQINLPDFPSYIPIDSIEEDTGSYTYIYDTVPGLHGGIDVWSLESTSDGGYTVAGRNHHDQYHLIILKSNADGTLEPCYFDCVWPGDADNNGIVDMDDMLAIGITYGETGVERIDASIDWLPHMAWQWTDTLADGTNLQFTDCNGDGLISDDDTLAVSLNYAAEHELNSFKEIELTAPLFIQDPGGVLAPGYHELPIILGESTAMVDAIYGLRFTIQYTGGIADPSSFNISFGDSWFGTSAELLQMDKNFPGEILIDAALVRSDHVNKSGYGQIGTLGFEITSNTGEMLLTINNEHAIDKAMNEVPIYPQSLMINGESTGLNNSSSDEIDLYPNPATDEITIGAGNYTLKAIKIFDITGKIMKSVSSDAITGNKLNVSDLIVGSYILKVETEELSFVRNLAIIR